MPVCFKLRVFHCAGCPDMLWVGSSERNCNDLQPPAFVNSHESCIISWISWVMSIFEPPLHSWVTPAWKASSMSFDNIWCDFPHSTSSTNLLVWGDNWLARPQRGKAWKRSNQVLSRDGQRIWRVSQRHLRDLQRADRARLEPDNQAIPREDRESHS